MDDNGQCENGRHKQDQYKLLHTQWMNSPNLMKDHHAITMKFMSILAERDAAIQERNLAVSEKKAALAERDIAIMQREAAIAERNNALMERDHAMAALEYRKSIAVNCSTPTCTPGCGIPRGTKHVHHLQHIHHLSHLNEAAHTSRNVNVIDALPIPATEPESIKSRRAKRMKADKSVQPKKAVKLSKRVKRGSEDISKHVPFAKPIEWKIEKCADSNGEDFNNQFAVSKPEWKGNQVSFDDLNMPVPGCSCTGVLQQCYKWGKGGWQSACCTTTLSVYPLPVMPNKRHARLGGRKMSGSAFAKLLSRLASEDHDWSAPLDLKDHWARHGTNRYITIK